MAYNLNLAGFAVNPARDLGPRILTAMVGYGREVFNFRHQYWLWCPILAPCAGALVATFIYDTFLFAGMDSILNRRYVNLCKIMSRIEVIL